MQEIPREQIRLLAQKMLSGTITPEEQQLLEEWLHANPGNELVWEEGDANETELGNRIFRRISAHTIAHTRLQRRKKIYWAAAASLLFLVSATIYFLNPGRKPAATEMAKAAVTPVEILPGSDKATLTLGDGRQVTLEGQKIITDGDLQIRNENNELVYANTSIVSLNTMSTPRGGQYQLRLPDGSRVWLNASSSLTYPTAFTGKERMVELSGEAYFEVSPYSSPTGGGREGADKMPFIVKINDMNVHVLGTHFNVMGYDDETAIKTTLLEGSVQITKGNAKELLKPGQEANVTAKEEKIRVANGDIEQATAWKNGMFLFNKTDIKSIMRQLSRWYDFDVHYENAFENRNFSGMISRKTELSKVLKMLQMTKDVKFKIEGRTVTVI